MHTHPDKTREEEPREITIQETTQFAGHSRRRTLKQGLAWKLRLALFLQLSSTLFRNRLNAQKDESILFMSATHCR